MSMIGVYLLAIVLANLSIARFGAEAAIINAALFIALDLTARDHLHEQWAGRGLRWKMAALITGGSLLSYALNRNAGQIAMASLVAFAAAGMVDTFTYWLLRDNAKLIKVNGSNVASAAVDSIVFPALAFGLPLMIPVMVGQFTAKVGGGFLWSLVMGGLQPHPAAGEGAGHEQSTREVEV